MKVKAAKGQTKPSSKLVNIKKTKADIQKAKNLKTELKINAPVKKADARSVAVPLTFTEKKVLSVKRKSKATKAASDTPSEMVKAGQTSKLEKPMDVGNCNELKMKKKTKKVTEKRNHDNQKSDQSVVTNKKSDREQTNGDAGSKKVAIKRKNPVQKQPEQERVAKQHREGGLKMEGTDSEPVNETALKSSAVEKKPKGKKKQSGAQKVEKVSSVPEETGFVATEVTEETLALVPKEIISSASFKLLFEFVKKKVSLNEKNRLFGEDLKYGLQITAVKRPMVPARNARITLPHSTLRPESDICLIVRDLQRGRKIDYSATKQKWEDKLRELGLKESITVIPFRQLKEDYREYEMRKKLVHRFARFFVDARISGHVYHMLGKIFIKRLKNAIPLKLDEGHDVVLKKNLEKATRTETYHQTNANKQSCIKFAAEWMPVEHAVENGMALIEKLKEIHPGGWLNIQSLHLVSLATSSTSFPIYMGIIDPNLIPVPKKTGPREKFVAKQNALLSRLTGGKYQVTVDGVLQDISELKKKPAAAKGKKKRGAVNENKKRKEVDGKRKAEEVEHDVEKYEVEKDVEETEEEFSESEDE